MPSVTVTQRARVDRDPVTRVHTILFEFQEDSRTEIHRATNNNEDLVVSGETYVATDIRLGLPNSSESDANVTLDASNITRIFGRQINLARAQIGVRIMLIDVNVPASPLIDTGNLLVMRDASGDGVRISATLAPRGTLQEPVPYRRTSKQFFPGVWFAK